MVVSHFIHAGLPFGTIKVTLSIIIFSRAYLERVLWDFRVTFSLYLKQHYLILTDMHTVPPVRYC